MDEIRADAIASYEAKYPRLFGLLRQSGWAPGRPSGLTLERPWIRSAYLLPVNAFSLAFTVELEGRRIQQGRHAVRFFPDTAFDTMAALDDYDADILRIVGTEAAPVAEGGGKVLFVAEDHRAALIDQTLCGFARAADPFVLLEWFLFSTPSPAITHAAVPVGQRVVDAPGFAG